MASADQDPPLPGQVEEGSGGGEGTENERPDSGHGKDAASRKKGETEQQNEGGDDDDEDDDGDDDDEEEEEEEEDDDDDEDEDEDEDEDDQDGDEDEDEDEDEDDEDEEEGDGGEEDEEGDADPKAENNLDLYDDDALQRVSSASASPNPQDEKDEKNHKRHKDGSHDPDEDSRRSKGSDRHSHTSLSSRDRDRQNPFAPQAMPEMRVMKARHGDVPPEFVKGSFKGSFSRKSSKPNLMNRQQSMLRKDTDAIDDGLFDALSKARSNIQEQKDAEMAEVFGNLFEQLDTDKGGTLDVDGELLQALQKLGQDILLNDLRIAMEKVIQRKHDRVEKANVFQKRLVWDCMYKEEFIKVMLVMAEPNKIEQAKSVEREIFSVFQEFDADRSGSIDAEELGKAMKKLGRDLNEAELEELIARIDTGGTGEVSFVDFAALFGIEASPIDYAEVDRAEQLNQLVEARAAFKAFDLDKSNSIDITELGAIMKTMGKKLTDKKLQDMMNSVDKDKSGEIDFFEFCSLLGIEWNPQLDIDLKEIDKQYMKKTKQKGPRNSSEDDEEHEHERSYGPHAPPAFVIQQEHSPALFAEYSPNGKYVGVCSSDDSVKVWQFKNGKAIRLSQMKGHQHTVIHLAWSPDSERLVSASADKLIHLWHVKTGESLQSTKAHSAYIRGVAWAPNGHLLATCSSDKTIKLWNPITMAQKKLLLGHSNWVRWVRFSPDSKLLISGGDDNFFIIWSVPEGQIVQRIPGHKDTLSAACFLNRKGYQLRPIVTAAITGQVNMWLPDNGLTGFMHYAILGIESLPEAPEGVIRYVVLEVGRNRHKEKSDGYQGDSMDFEADGGIKLSCSIWDTNEVVRVQLFEFRPKVSLKLLGEYKTTHGELIVSGQAEGIQKRFHMTTPEEEQLSDGGESGMTVLRMKILFERMEHNANLKVTVQEGKNMKKLEGNRFVTPRVVIKTQRGQEYHTPPVMSSKTPQWHVDFTFGIGQATSEIHVSAQMVNKIENTCEEFGSCALKMDKLLSKVCSQQEPLSNWYVVRGNTEDRKSCGSVRLQFAYTEASKEHSKKYLHFGSPLSAVRAEEPSIYAPRRSLRLFGRTLWKGACRWCHHAASHHDAQGRCESEDPWIPSSVICLTVSSDGALAAWGTDKGLISIVATDTGDQLALWKAHYQWVYSVNFSPDDTSLISSGLDVHPVLNSDEAATLSPEEIEALPRKSSVLRWDLEGWLKNRLKSR